MSAPVFKVDVSFYVEADSAEQAEQLVATVMQSLQEAQVVVHKQSGNTFSGKIALFKEVLGDADIHEGETIAWDMSS